jgi:hypothetical protein
MLVVYCMKLIMELLCGYMLRVVSIVSLVYEIFPVFDLESESLQFLESRKIF